MIDDALSWWARLGLAFQFFFRALFNPRIARGGQRLLSAPPEPPQTASPTAPPAPAAAPAEPEGATRDPECGTSSEQSRADWQPALQLLALLQREGRLIDFLRQDIASFDDAAIGAAARVVHEGCRKGLDTHVTIVPVRAESEGSEVELGVPFDTVGCKLIGEVGGALPARGVLRHRGWRVEKLELPQSVGRDDALILAQAEIEL